MEVRAKRRRSSTATCLVMLLREEAAATLLPRKESKVEMERQARQICVTD